MSKSLNIVFAGTPEFAALHLAGLIQSQHNVIAAYTQPDRPAGRGKKLQQSAVKQLALLHDIPVYQPVSFKDADAQQQLAAMNADVMVVVAYGLILPQVVLDTPRLGCLNVHGSLLPRWRGAAPIQRSIWAGDKVTGVTLMQMDQGLDTGPMLLKKTIDIESTDTSATLYTKLAETGPLALLDCLNQLEQLSPETQQDDAANYAQKLSKQEAKIDWHLDATQLERNIRAFNPWPVAYFSIAAEGHGNLDIKVWGASVVELPPQHQQLLDGEIIRADKQGILVKAGSNGLLINSLQLPGKKAMPVRDILNAKKEWFTPGQVLA
ncbi:methionyl-tRNA formyltransferase [Aliiglaciecola sp. LCG003]|uniref:methionyl-tRNA formyltransferase n=1 Tax=Aliiglaciecola sp. LCG003 TaxID=3053655 RepID=UPI002572CE88|nr:methionyl-tRNA formyltransferase [Aliiglaciecola sp. LCG003]WJG09475.1 methionyl-tRNA formyltransferase [Aliiglaciecola sp. LCG003]